MDLPFSTGRRMRLVMQAQATECALACIAMICGYYGQPLDLVSLRRRFNVSMKGITLRGMVDIAHRLGLDSRARRADLEYLAQLDSPCILHWDLNHFVVLSRVTRRGAEIFDPGRGRFWMPLAEVGKHFTGVLLQLAPGPTFRKSEATPPVSLRMLTGDIRGLVKVAVQLFGMALAMEVLSLLVPFQMQWTLDHVLVTGDSGLLLVIALGFVVVMAITAAVGFARAWVISWVGASMGAQWTNNLFSHLMRLPMDFFEKRHVGDLVSRFYSVQSIQTTVTGAFIEAILDGLLGLLALVILIAYSGYLACIVGAGFVVYAALRVAMYRSLFTISEEQLVFTARQQSELMESIRGIQAIKLGGKQAERKARLKQATYEAALRTMRSQRISLGFGVVNQFLFGSQRVLLVALGAYLVLRGTFSAGMLVAFIAYADQFGTKMGNLIDKLVDLRLLRLHTRRISDIALTQIEPHAHGSFVGPDPEPRIVLRGVSFRYADNEPWIFRDLNVTIEAGESVAIIGPSGFGKSTMAKLLVGLLEPVEGSVEMGGVDIRALGMDRYRRMIGAVMQDDQLFAGSIADNIALFDPEASLDEIIRAAIIAQIHDEVTQMPMGYESLVGDMGAALSGGQKQRIVLARAIYRHPSILVLDEATSHLDPARERAINAAIGSLSTTRIIIAHRMETIASAGRILDVMAIDGLPKGTGEADQRAAAAVRDVYGVVAE